MIPGIQARMVNQLAQVYGQPMTPERFKEVAASLGVGLVARQAVTDDVRYEDPAFEDKATKFFEDDEPTARRRFGRRG